MISSLALSLALLSPAAHAGKCDALIKKADTVSPEALPAAFAAAAACSSDEAGASYTRFMTRATDSDILVQLSLAAIDADIWNPVWTMPTKISDYATRDLITGQVGAACADHPKVVTFLQGAYMGLRAVDFQQWDDAFSDCGSPELDGWLEAQLKTPPSGSYDEKFDLLMGIYVSRKGPGALPALKDAAIAAHQEGPFDAILMKMDESVAPKLGASISPENQSSIEAALVAIAQKVSPDKARAVADRLVAAGAEASAARLLPVVFPDRIQGGSFRWGGLSVERADCKGVKTAVMHTAEITEPGKRWIVTDEAVSGLRTFKPKLKKCTVEEGEWPVVISPEPLVPGGLDAWARSVGAEWAGQGYTVELKGEAGITLP